MKTNPLLRVKRLGQSIWLDYIQRELITSGELQRLIAQDGICGVTSNPAIFEKAIIKHHDYDAAINTTQADNVNILYEQLVITDLQQAADLLRPIYDSTQGRDGFVSFEVAPQLADDTAATTQEARRLWEALDRPNSMIKVPATVAGIAAIKQLISEGININATLLFSLPRYQAVAEAYLAGLEVRMKQGATLTNIASVASFFLSRIDSLIDRKLDSLPTTAVQSRTKNLRGQTAIASARLAYQLYKQLYKGARWQRLVAAGATPQRLLWASTSTKDPNYSDVKYVEALIGKDTINTLPLETLSAYRDHGQPAVHLDDHIELARNTLAGLAEIGLDLDTLTHQLEREGVQKFTTAYTSLLDNLRQRLNTNKNTFANKNIRRSK